MDDQPIPHGLPRPEHLAYLANLLTVLGILYGVWILQKRRRSGRKTIPGVPLANDYTGFGPSGRGG